MSIPARVHFVWIGTRLPWPYVFAVLSAAERSELPEIILHHTESLEDSAAIRALQAATGVRLSQIDPIVCLAQAGATLGVGDRLAAVYGKLEKPTMRADMLRAAILYLQGGIYLDLDTVTTKSLQPFLSAPNFVGCELIVWTRAVLKSRSPFVWARHLTLDLIRKGARHMSDGWEKFRRVERFYSRSLNNAVMGAEPGSRLFADYLNAMLHVPMSPPPRPYAFGPHLLQDVVRRYRGSDLAIQDPRVFYPMPPEISDHWFRMYGQVRLDEVLWPETRVVHWYASVRTKFPVALIDPQFVRDHRGHQLFSALVWSCVRRLP